MTRIAQRILWLAAVGLGVSTAAAGEELTVRKVLDIHPVWAGHPVGFCLLTTAERQVAAFYDDRRRMTVADRRLGEDRWRLVRLPERLGWDSHNYVTLARDTAGRLHLAGNMHCDPLVYFRTERADDITTFRRVERMVGRAERRVTYPRFFAGPEGRMIFTYRDGGSGRGDQLFNVYDAGSGRWSRLLETPLTDGEGERNAYIQGPTRGPKGSWHVAWVWRDTPDCATNHDISYARSRDLRTWRTAAGKPVDLPMTIETPGLVVDPVPAGGGAINTCVRLGFDHDGRAIVSYVKYDDAGKTQLYNARLEDGRWRVVQTSDWDCRWAFGGGGSIPSGVRIGEVRPGPDGRLVQRYGHPKEGSGTWLLDAETLKPVGRAPRGPRRPKELRRPESGFPGMHVRWRPTLGTPPAGTRHELRWETLGPNRDRPRKPPLPEPSMLRLVVFDASP